MITKKPIQRKFLLSVLFEKVTPLTEVKNPLYGSNTSLIDGMDPNEASSSAPSTVENNSEVLKKKKTSELDSSKVPVRKYYISSGPAFLNSNFKPPTLQPLSKLQSHRDDFWTPQLPSEKFQLKP